MIDHDRSTGKIERISPNCPAPKSPAPSCRSSCALASQIPGVSGELRPNSDWLRTIGNGICVYTHVYIHDVYIYMMCIYDYMYIYIYICRKI